MYTYSSGCMHRNRRLMKWPLTHKCVLYNWCTFLEKHKTCMSVLVTYKIVIECTHERTHHCKYDWKFYVHCVALPMPKSCVLCICTMRIYWMKCSCMFVVKLNWRCKMCVSMHLSSNACMLRYWVSKAGTHNLCEIVILSVRHCAALLC